MDETQNAPLEDEELEGEEAVDEAGEKPAAAKADDSEIAQPNPNLEKFLQQWDRNLNDDRRAYGIKLVFAGCESKKVRDGLYRIGVRHILVSYFYLRQWLKTASVQEIGEDLGRFDFVFLDSGGFTFIDAIRRGKDLGINVKQYADEFYADLPRFGHLFAGCAEIDVIDLGQSYMEEMKRQMLDKGVPIVPVVQGEPLDTYGGFGWWDMYPYIAVGSALIGDPKYTGYLNQLYDVGKDRGLVFHGFGATGAQTILRSRFYSVDSTSWTGGSRFGTTMVFQNGRIRHYDKDHKDVRKRFKRRFEESGVIWADIEADKGFEVDMMNALAWKQWADYVKYSATKCYWLKWSEKEKALTLKAKAFNAEGVLDRSKSMQRAGFRRLSVVTDAGYDDRAHETLLCNSCHLSGRCPRYKPDNPCGYDVNIRLESKADLQKAMQTILETQFGRTMTGVLFEKMEGGVIDRNVTAEMNTFLAMVSQVKSVFDPRGEEELTIRAKGSQGAVAQMLASVFAPKGVTAPTGTQRAAARVLEPESSADVIDVEVEDEPSRVE